MLNNSIKILYTNDIMDIFGISRTKALMLMKLPGFPSLKIGRNFIVTQENLEQWMNDHKNKEVIL